MSSIPVEFDPAHISSQSNPDAQMYHAELSSKDPMQSVLKNNPEIYFVPPKRSRDWGKVGIQTRLILRHHYWFETCLLEKRGSTKSH